MKKFILMFISSAMLFTSSVYAEEVSTNFWAYEQVMEANNDGWLDKSLNPNDYALKSTAESAVAYFCNGYDTPSESSGEYITRGALADILSEYLPDDGKVFEVSFSDMAESEHIDGIQKCVEAGIFNGYADGTFKPDNRLSNAELAAVISNLKKNRTEALKLYEKINEKYKNLKSLTMDMNMDIDMSMKLLDSEEENMSHVMTGSFKTVVNDLEKFDIEMSGSLDSSSDKFSQKVNLYYKDNTYYLQNGDLKIKTELDFNEVMSKTGLDYNSISELDKNSIVLGYVKVNDDKTKDLYVSIDADEMVYKFAFMPKEGDEVKNISQIIHIDENDNMTGYDLECSMRIGDDDGHFDYGISAEYKLKDINNTVIDVPDDLDTYIDIEDVDFDAIRPDDF